METATLSLTPFGFTELESRLYAELLRQSPATGYKLARAVGKATANTYQALEGLTRKGAVIDDDADPRSYRPVPPEELFSVLRQSFLTQSEAAQDALSALYAPAPEDRLYHLKTLPQAIERARTLIDKATEILLFDLFDYPLFLLRDELIHAHQRGVAVGGIVYSHETPMPFTTQLAPGASFTTDHWPGRQMTLIADAREVLLALISPDEATIRTGFWSDSSYLACLHHSGLSSEMRLSAVSGEGSDPLQHFGLLSARPPGLRDLTRPSASSAS